MQQFGAEMTIRTDKTRRLRLRAYRVYSVEGLGVRVQASTIHARFRRLRKTRLSTVQQQKQLVEVYIMLCSSNDACIAARILNTTNPLTLSS